MPSAPPATISPSGATATALSGVGSVTITGARAGERPDADGGVVAGAHHRVAVRREGDAVDVLLVAFEHARRSPPSSGQSRTVWSQDAEASVAPSGETASATTGAVCPSSTASGVRSPALQSAMRPSSPPVTARPSASIATALTAPSWKRSTCSAAVGGQRPADRRGIEAAGDAPGAVARNADRPHRPAMPAQLGVRAGGAQHRRQQGSEGPKNRTSICDGLARDRPPLEVKSGIGKAHAERLDARARAGVGERREERLHRLARPAARHHEKVIVLGRERQEAETVDARDRLDRDAPIGAALRDRGGDRICELGWLP